MQIPNPWDASSGEFISSFLFCQPLIVSPVGIMSSSCAPPYSSTSTPQSALVLYSYCTPLRPRVPLVCTVLSQPSPKRPSTFSLLSSPPPSPLPHSPFIVRLFHFYGISLTTLTTLTTSPRSTPTTKSHDLLGLFTYTLIFLVCGRTRAGGEGVRGGMQ
ncbi:hypothetical protein HOY82DRAFT_489943 [Tuber indicum]|nr:hypothetical protein HOY82DRAFT_489943 [Tuber indicum]